MKQTSAKLVQVIALSWIVGCVPPPEPVRPVVPSLDYTNNLRSKYGVETVGSSTSAHAAAVQQAYAQQAYENGTPAPKSFMSPAAPAVNNANAVVGDDRARARVKFVKDEVAPAAGVQAAGSQVEDDKWVRNDTNDPSFYVHRSSMPNTRDYSGPLSLGDPGVSASLWQEGRSHTDLYRDDRAFEPMDLITIVVSESSAGSKEADTQTKQSSSVLASIASFFGLEKQYKKANSDFDPTSIVSASTSNDFKGQGQTTRKGSLTAKISGMVVETLPSGVLRVEGEKIISVNNEEQVMIISGLVRRKDINADNEVDSSKIANMRIDYFGKGTVGETQYGGWLARMMRVLWPF